MHHKPLIILDKVVTMHKIYGIMMLIVVISMMITFPNQSFAVDAEPHITFTFDVKNLHNVVGIHMHNGSPGHSSTVHLVDFFTSDLSLFDNIPAGTISHMNGQYTGTITQDDLCPAMHDHGHGTDTSHCTTTLDDVANEMAAGRAYVQFHTDDGQPPINMGPGDLSSPGEIRGDITGMHENTTMFAATADASQNVFEGNTVPSQWNNVSATAFLSLTAHGIISEPHITFTFDVKNLHNVVGIHMHNGSPGHSSTVHLVDFFTSDLSLFDDIPAGTISHMNGQYTGTITQDDLCPAMHDHGHGTDTSHCTTTLDDVANEMAAGRAYVQFHTDDGQPPINMGPGDLSSPGEIRGDITGMHENTTMFAATADASQNVFEGNTVPSQWNNVSATAFLSLTAHGIVPDKVIHTVISVPASSSRITPTPVISGTSPVGVFVDVYSGTLNVGQATSDSFGSWSLSVETQLNAGHHELTAVATDGLGNSFVTSDAVAVAVVDELGEISGSVYVDSDPYSGDSITLYATTSASSQTLQTQTMDGKYMFANLIPDNYRIQIDIPPGYFLPDFDIEYSVSKNVTSEVDIVLQKTSTDTAPSVRGTVFSDDDGNGIQNNESGVAGIDIIAISETGKTVHRVTDANGEYSFECHAITISDCIDPGRTVIQTLAAWSGSVDGLLDSDHGIIRTGFLPHGYLMSDGFTHYIHRTLEASSDSTVDFPLSSIDERASLTGVIHEDDDGDGMYGQEAGFQNVDVFVTELSSGKQHIVQTNSRGFYSLEGLMPYEVQIETGLIPKDHLPQKEYSTSMAKQLAAGPNTANFPMRHIHSGDSVTVSGLIFRDDNSNGIRESGEDGMPNMLVTATAMTTGQSESANTDHDGTFNITGVMPDQVQIKTSLPAGFHTTTSNNGVELHDLSDGQTKPIQFGLAQTPQFVTLQVNAWHDADGDGVRSAGESGIPNASVLVYSPILALLVTDSDGTAMKTDLPVSDFSAVAISLDGYQELSKSASILHVSNPVNGSTYVMNLGFVSDS